MSVNVGTAVGYLDLDINGFVNKFKEAKEQAEKDTETMSQKISGKLTSIGSTLESAGSGLTKSVTLPILAVGTAGLKVATDFEKSMSNVKAISGATGEDFTKLRDKAVDLGASTAFSSKEVADAMTEMAKAGWSTNQILDGMSGVLDSAAASGESLGNVATIVADAITGFGLAASDSTKVADLLAQAANAGTIDIADLGESFKYVAPVAKSLGYNVEDVTTAIAAMSTAGIKGSQAGTALRTLFTNMAKPTESMEGAMKDLGVSLYDTSGNMYTMKEVLDQLRSGFGKLMISNEEFNATYDQMNKDLQAGNITQKEYAEQLDEIMRKTFGAEEAEKARAAATLAGKEGLSGLLSIVNMTQEEYDALSESMYNSAGVANQTATVMQDNLQSKVEQLGGSLESLAIKLSEYVIPMFQEWVIKLTDMVDKFTKMDPEMQKSILKMAVMAAAAGPLLIALGKMFTAAGTVVSVFGKMPAVFAGAKTAMTVATTSFLAFGDAMKLSAAGYPALAAQSSGLFKAFTLLTGPIGLIIAAVGLLIAAFVSLWKNNEEFRTNIIEIWDGIKKTFEDFANGVVDRINALGFNFESLGEVVKAVWNTFTAILAPVFEIAFATIGAVLDAALTTILGLLDVFIGIFTGNWDQVWNGLSSIVTAGIEMVKTVLTSAYTYINEATGGALDKVVGFFKALPGNIKTFIDQVIDNITTWATNMASKAVETGENFIKSIVDFFDKLPYNIGYYTALALVTISQWVYNTTMKAVEMGKNFIDSVVTFFTTLPGKVYDFTMNAYNHVVNWAVNMPAKAKEMGENFIKKVVEFFSTLPDRAKEWLDNTVEKAKVWVTDMHEEGGNAIKELIANFIEGAKEIPEKMAQIGKNIVDGVWKGIKDAKDAFVDNVKDFFSGIVDGAKDALDINSPSKEMEREVGKWIPLGISSGFVKSMPLAISQIQTALTNGMNGLKVDGEESLLTGATTDMISNMKSMYADFVNWLGDIRDSSVEVAKEIADSLKIVGSDYTKFVSTGIGYVGVSGFEKSSAGNTNDYINPVNNGNQSQDVGDTFIFNSPKPIDEMQATRLMKQTKRDMAEGFI